jgi:hypothetical protein
MGKIVEFPGNKRLGSSSNLTAEPLENTATSQSSKFDFTCVSCKNVTHFELGNAVFKQLELFCSKCGSGWKVTNPIFANTKARSN